MNTDYFSKTTPRVRVFTDRIEFMNPGCLPKKLDIILKEDYTFPRNKVIAKCLRYLNIAEEMGSGFHKMIDGWNSYYKNQPKFSNDYTYFKVEFYFDEKVMSPVAKKIESVENHENNIDIIEMILKYVPSVSQVCPKLISEEELKLLVEEIFLRKSLSAQEIQKIFDDKNRTRVRNKYILPLIEIGVLELLYPDKPKSSKQKYLLSNEIIELLSRIT
jgi:predicted HTH transcriptional regulator